ncbi:MAG: Na+/H+ antiporter NhaC family protein [Myxococcota bacterium]|nr:Na+/H+ antiporter NhaC family protein [Myxococcota bacterium]
MNQKLLLTLVTAVVLAALSSGLPISEKTVETHTLSKLVRDSVSQLELNEATPSQVRFLYEGPEELKATVRGIFDRQPGWTWVDEPAATALTVSVERSPSHLRVAVKLGEQQSESSARLSTWLSLLPPLMALVIAIGLRHVVLALFVAAWVGVTIVDEFNPLSGFIHTWTDYVFPVVTDTFNLQILGFTFALVGMVAVIGKMGGTQGLVNVLSRFAQGPRSAQVVTAMMGTAVFFDDYANTVVVGSTAKGLTDRMKMSREKLAYIVDSTSAPIAGIAVVSTWIGYEVGLFDSILAEYSHIRGLPNSGYALFFEVLPLRFYCIFALTLVFLGAILGRDLGPMARAEWRARSGGGVVAEDVEVDDAESASIAKEGTPPRWYNAVIPIAVVLGFIFVRILAVGGSAVEGTVDVFDLDHWRHIFDRASDDIGAILFGGSLLGSLVAMTLAQVQGLLTVGETLDAYRGGIFSLLEAGAILILAWVIKNVCDDIGTGMALVGLLGDGLSPLMIPLVVFLLAGVVAFATGTSWGTMALVLPVAAPLSVIITGGDPLIFVLCMGAVLDGAIWGDHCSPISDTTVLSSTATGCPHMEHVKTQLPYALASMVAAGSAGYVGYAAGWPIGACYGVGLVLLVGALLIFGDNPEKPETF